MKTMIKPLAFAGLAISAAMAVPSSAQVQGNMATVDAATVVVGSTAFQNAYNSINSTYKPQLDTRRTLQQQRQTQLAALDTDGNSTVDEAEVQAAEAAGIGVAEVAKILVSVDRGRAVYALYDWFRDSSASA